MENQRNTKKVPIQQSDIDQIKANLDKVMLTVNNLNNAIIGNKDYGQIGIIQKIDEHETYIEKDKGFKHKIIGMGIILGLIWSYVLKLITT